MALINCLPIKLDTQIKIGVNGDQMLVGGEGGGKCVWFLSSPQHLLQVNRFCFSHRLVICLHVTKQQVYFPCLYVEYEPSFREGHVIRQPLRAGGFGTLDVPSFFSLMWLWEL